MLSYIKVNDIFDELIDENKKLRECLKVFIEFKICVDLYLKDITIASDSVNQQKVIQLTKDVEDVFEKNFNGFNDFRQKQTIVSKVVTKLESNRIDVKDSKEDNKLFKCDVNECDFSTRRKAGLQSHK